MSDGGAVADVETIRARAEKAKRTPDLGWARDLVHGLADDVLALVSERERLQQRAETAESARSHLGEVNSVQRDRLREAEAERDRLAAAMVRLADDYRIADMQRNGADQAMRAEVERLTAQLDGVHLALAEANIERAAGVDEPLWSEQHRVRLLAAQRDALAAQLAEAQRAIREAYDYGCEWPIGTSDEPQEQRGGPRDTFIRNMAAALAGSPGWGAVERTQ